MLKDESLLDIHSTSSDMWVFQFVKKDSLRLARLIAVVGFTSLAWSDGSLVDELEKMLSEPGNDGELLTMLAEGVELIGESSLELLTGDIRELGFGD